MKKVLLISNHVFHYRSNIYNYFFEMFNKNGYEFYVLTNSIQDVDFDIKFNLTVKPFSFKGYIKEIKNLNPDIVINFLHLKDKLIIPLTLFCKSKNIPMIYWNHGINLKTPEAKIKNKVFNFIHTISDAIILYTPNELKYISEKNKIKTFIAYNTLNFNNINKKIIADKDFVKEKYNIREDKIILYVSRILEYKNVDALLNNFKNEKNVGLVIVGNGISEYQMKIINENSNYYYLGEKYGVEVDEIYNMGDVFSTPGHIGLALNQAFYWGKPVVILEGKHAPEIYYMKDKETGYIVKNETELKEKIISLLRNEKKLLDMSEACRNIIKNEASIESMFNGFMSAIKYCEK